MSDKEEKLRRVQKKTRLRLLFALVTLVLYFSFTLNWTGSGSALGATLPGTAVTGSLLMFVTLIIVFIGMEILFLLMTREDPNGESGD